MSTSSNSVKQELFSEPEVLGMLGVSTSTLQRWRDKGYIKFHKIGKRRRYTRDQIDSFLNQFNIE